MVFPGLLVLLLWLIKITEVAFHTSFADFGLEPQTVKGLRGIIFSPLLHADWAHLSSNSVPLFLLASALFYYYGRQATSIFILCWLVTGLWVWIFAADTGTHIGASGVVYALATFHFTSGILRREPRMMAFSMLVVFLYGGLVWGISPDFFPGKNISWQSHLLGGIAGIILAFGFRKEGPQRKTYQWENEEDDEDEDQQKAEEDYLQEDEPADTEPGPGIQPPNRDISLNYTFKENGPHDGNRKQTE